MTLKELEMKLREVMGQSALGSRPIGEKEALEAGLNVAEEWKMRLEEIEAEEKS